MPQILENFKQWLLKYELKIVLIVGFCLVSAVSYEFGMLQGQKMQQKPLIIENKADISREQQNTQNEPSASSGDTTGNQLVGAKGAVGDNKSCAFVGSKNSTKFYIPTCTWAKRIKPENLVCYKSEQEAIGKGKIKSECK